MITKVRDRIIRWNCCGREITYIADSASVKALRHRCNFCKSVGASWNDTQDDSQMSYHILTEETKPNGEVFRVFTPIEIHEDEA